MKKLFLSLACLLPTLLMAKMPAVADTVWVDDEMDVVKRAKATRYGIVQDMDTVNNIVTIQFFEPGTERKDIIRRLELKEKEGRVRSRLLSETLLYPDGAILEELVFTTPEGEEGKASRTYDRKLFYPNGNLQYEEKLNEKGEHDCVYYKPNGKVNNNPKESIPLYQTMPAYPGGQKALRAFLSENVKFPEEAKKNGIEGRVIMQFVVDKDGSIGKVKVVRSCGDKSLDNEAIRVIRIMPNWKPGTIRGKNVRTTFRLPVNFRQT